MSMHMYIYIYVPSQSTESNLLSHPQVTWNRIKAAMNDTIYKITAQKFALPTDGKEVLVKGFMELNEEIVNAFRSLED